MNKKKNLLALALSVSFVLGANSISYAEEDINQIPQAKEETQNLDKAVNELVSEDKEQEEVPATDKAVENLEEEKTTPVDASNKENESLQVSDAVNPENVGATESTEPNYADDEKEIKDFDDKERYRSTQMEQGNGPTDLSTESNMDSKDGFSYKNLEPSATSEDKTKWGIEIEIDKEKGQRTYTDFSFTNSGKMAEVLDPGSVSSKEEGEKLAEGFKDPNYKAKSEIDITASRQQRNLNFYASEEDIKHINNVDNKNTTMAWEGHYTKDNPNGLKATEGSNVAFTFTVNPWPNENDRLSLIKLNGTHDQKEFVQGQTITTNVRVENLDENARLRLVGQVYHPITGEVVEGAKAYINDEGKVVVEMPKGAVDENGNINKDSIFYKDPKYKGIQNLEVKFFARPRTKAEFEQIIANDEENIGTYTQTGAGTRIINHKGEDVEVDLQGIDRYDRYNLIGGFKINLDDTRYYDQGFIDGNDDDTSKHTSSAVKPGEELEVKLYVPEDKKDRDLFPNQKTPEEMEAAKKADQAVGSIDWQFIDKINEGKKEEDKWKLEYDESTLPTTFKITPPKSAKAGEFVAVPLTYTYTNGSTDVHWSHFVVQESTNNKPEYEVKVDFPTEEQKSTPELPEDPDNKKLEPKRYTIPEGTEFKDDKGNEWTVSIDETTGEVTAKPKDPTKFDGGETLRVPVVAHYKDPLKPDEDITEETKAEFVIKEKSLVAPDYDAKNGKAGDELTSSPKAEEDNYNRKPSNYTLEDGNLEGTYTDNEGNEWKVTINPDTGEVAATVPKAADGDTIKLDGTIINVPVTAHYKDSKGNEIGSKKANVQFLGSGTEGKYTYEEEIPFETKVEVVKDLEPGKWRYKVVDGKEQKGKTGSVTKEIIIKDSKVEGEPKIIDTVDPVDAIIEIGDADYTGVVTHTEKIETPFEVEYQYSDELEAGQAKVIQKGEKGSYDLEYSQKIKNGQADGEAETKKTNEKDPKKEIIVIGIKPVEKVVEKPFNTKYIYDENIEVGNEEEVTPGKNGSTIVTTSYDKENNKLVTEEKTVDPIDRVVRIGIKPVEKIVELGHDTEYRHNPELKEGEEKVIEEGSKGYVKYITTFNKETGKLEVSEERVEPTNKLVEYGSKTDGEFTYESEKAYDIIIRENPDLEAGKTNVIQEGKVGKTETTVKIENSKEVDRTTKTITEKQDKIIEIGTKNVCEIPPVEPEDPEKPGEEDPKDPEKPDEEDPKDPEEPDEEDPKDPEKPDEEDPKPEDKDTPEEPNENIEDKKIKIPQQKLTSISSISEAHASKEKSNPKTGIDGVGSVISGLVTSVGAMLLTKKKKEDQ